VDEMKRINVNISDDMHTWLKAESEKRGLTMNALVIFAIETYYTQQQMLPNMGRMLDQLEKKD